jgi:hypothetical protein
MIALDLIFFRFWTNFGKGKYIYYAEAGDEDVKGGAPKYFLALKGGSESSRYTKGGGYKLFKVLIQQGPGVFIPTIVNIIDGLEY